MNNISPLEEFHNESINRVKNYPNNTALKTAFQNSCSELVGAKYAYNFFWLGVPIIQVPQDLQALQEIIWETKPDLIIETGIAWGGSILFSASMLSLLETCNVIENGHVIGIDIDIREHNKKAILEHPLSKKITMVEGSSIDESTIKKIEKMAEGKRVMVCLDSNHTHDHVLAELKAYAPLVTKGCYCMVGDTGVEILPEDMTSDREWGRGNNPRTAVIEYLDDLNNKEIYDNNNELVKFEIDEYIQDKLLITGSHGGYLKRVD